MFLLPEHTKVCRSWDSNCKYKCSPSSTLPQAVHKLSPSVTPLHDWIFDVSLSDQEERTKAIEAFKEGKKDVLVATDVASKGLDFPAIQHVVNYDMPEEIENYGKTVVHMCVYNYNEIYTYFCMYMCGFVHVYT